MESLSRYGRALAQRNAALRANAGAPAARGLGRGTRFARGARHAPAPRMDLDLVRRLRGVLRGHLGVRPGGLGLQARPGARKGGSGGPRRGVRGGRRRGQGAVRGAAARKLGDGRPAGRHHGRAPPRRTALHDHVAGQTPCGPDLRIRRTAPHGRSGAAAHRSRHDPACWWRRAWRRPRPATSYRAAGWVCVGRTAGRPPGAAGAVEPKGGVAAGPGNGLGGGRCGGGRRERGVLSGACGRRRVALGAERVRTLGPGRRALAVASGAVGGAWERHPGAPFAGGSFRAVPSNRRRTVSCTITGWAATTFCNRIGRRWWSAAGRSRRYCWCRIRRR